MRKVVVTLLLAAAVLAATAQGQWVRVYGGGGTASNFAAQ